MGTYMLVVQGVETPIVCANQNEFDDVRKYLMEVKTYRHDTVYPEIFPTTTFLPLKHLYHTIQH